MSVTFFLLFLAHLLGDFYFQSHNVAVGKQDDSAMLRKHCRYYGSSKEHFFFGGNSIV